MKLHDSCQIDGITRVKLMIPKMQICTHTQTHTIQRFYKLFIPFEYSTSTSPMKNISSTIFTEFRYFHPFAITLAKFEFNQFHTYTFCVEYANEYQLHVDSSSNLSTSLKCNYECWCNFLFARHIDPYNTILIHSLAFMHLFNVIKTASMC